MLKLESEKGVNVKKHITRSTNSEICRKTIILAIILTIATLTLPVLSTNGTIVKAVNPSTGDENFIFSTMNITTGTRFNTTIWLYDVSDLFGWSVQLIVNDTLLNITRAWIPSTNPNYVFYGQTQIPLGPTFYDNNNNSVIERVKIGATELFGATAFTGDGLLAIIELEIIYTPSTGSVSCNLDIDNEETSLLDTNLSQIPCLKINGYYELTTESTITITAEPESIILGSNLTIYGYIIPRLNGMNITIWYKLNQTGTLWNELAEVKTNSTGFYNYTWATNELGTFEFKANWTGYGAIPGAQSEIILVNVKYESTITLVLSATNVTVGTEVTISGDINPDRENATVTIEYRRENTTNWTLLVEVQSNAQGTYDYTWIATKREIGTSLENDTFEFKASWTGDNVTFGNESPIRKLVVWKDHVSLTMNVEPKTPSFGSNVTISGKITPVLPNAGIEFYYNTTPSTEMRIYGTSFTDNQGNYLFNWSLPTTLISGYNVTLTAKFTASANPDYIKDYFNLTSYEYTPHATITIAGFPSTITLKIEPTTVSIHSNITISGRIISEQQIPHDQIITIKYRLKNTTHWLTLPLYGKTILTNETGHYLHVWKVTIAAGEYELIASWGGYGNVSGAQSNIANLTVIKLKPSLTLEVDPKTVTVGSNITLSGTLQLETGGPGNVNGSEILLRYKTENGEWAVLATVKTNSTGYYSYVWITNQTGRFTIEASWAGNQYYEAVAVTTTVTIEEPFIQKYLIYIIAGITIAIIAAVAAFLLLKKRKTS
jgi:hypothetical protein